MVIVAEWRHSLFPGRWALLDNGRLSDFHAIIPAGGVGSRLWPLSRADHPKFLHDLTGNGHTLLRNTWNRLVPLTGPEGIVVVTGSSHQAAVWQQLPELPSGAMVVEPSPKESTAAIGVAAAILQRRHPEAIVGSFAADHVITDERRFHEAVTEAYHVASQGEMLVTIGMRPTEPSSAFGYVRVGEPLSIDGAPHARRAAGFVEKPDFQTATHYVDSGDYLWNAGMFIARADLLLDLLRQSKPEIHQRLLTIAEAWDTPERDRVMATVWPELEKIAFDYSVAEPAAEAGHMAVIPGEFGWDDVGDFAALARLHSRGVTDLAVLGENSRVLADGASGIVVSQSERLVSVIGVSDIVVVDTPDALLVTTKENAQRVKALVDLLKLNGSDNVL